MSHDRNSNFLGGSEIQMIQIQDELVKQGHELTHVHVNFTKEKFPSFDSKDGFNTYHINVNPQNPFFEIVTYSKILSLFKNVLSKKIDVIYTRGSYYILPLSVIKKSYNIPVFCTLTSDAMCNNLLTRLKNGTFKKSHLISGILRDFFYSSIEMISQNNIQKQLFKSEFKIESSKINNGHQVINHNLEKSKIPIIVWISNIRKVKRLEVFLRLVEKFQNSKAIFVCVGKAHSNDRLLLSKAESKCKNFKYLGKIDFESCNKLLEKSSLLVNTSKIEGFSNTFIQAWLRQVPVITINIDPDNVISKYKLGYVAKNEEELYGLTKSLIIDNSKLQIIGRHSQKFAEKNYTIASKVSEYIDLFKRFVVKI